MTRIEENQITIDSMLEISKAKQTGIYEEMVPFQLGVISAMLADISKSLAIIAGKAESEVKE